MALQAFNDRVVAGQQAGTIERDVGEELLRRAQDVAKQAGDGHEKEARKKLDELRDKIADHARKGRIASAAAEALQDGVSRLAAAI